VACPRLQQTDEYLPLAIAFSVTVKSATNTEFALEALHVSVQDSQDRREVQVNGTIWKFSKSYSHY